MSNSNKIVLKSSDGQIFEIEEAVALQSQTIAHMVEDDDYVNNVISLANITGETLAKVMEYCKKHVDGGSEKELKTWDAEFMKIMDQSTLFDLVQTAKFLNMENLFDLTCQTVADMIESKTPEEIRAIFNLEYDYTPEEEAKIHEEYKWAFE